MSVNIHRSLIGRCSHPTELDASITLVSCAPRIHMCLHRSTSDSPCLTCLTHQLPLSGHRVPHHLSSELEYCAFGNDALELLWFRQLLKDMGITYSSMIVLHYDNQNAIQIIHNNVFHEYTKHIKIDNYFIHHHVIQESLHLILVFSSIKPQIILPKHIFLTIWRLNFHTHVSIY